MEQQATLTFKARHHAYMIALMTEKNDVQKIRYINQVVNQIVDITDREQEITVTVSCDLILQLYVVLGSQPERITAAYNDEIKKALLPQLPNYPELAASIQNIAQNNAAETEQLVSLGFAFIEAIKQ